jgi:hypothetical protein
VAPPVFKTGLAANIVAGGFDSLPPPPLFLHQCSPGDPFVDLSFVEPYLGSDSTKLDFPFAKQPVDRSFADPKIISQFLQRQEWRRLRTLHPRGDTRVFRRPKAQMSTPGAFRFHQVSPQRLHLIGT